jgi:hypothetical protein
MGVRGQVRADVWEAAGLDALVERALARETQDAGPAEPPAPPPEAGPPPPETGLEEAGPEAGPEEAGAGGAGGAEGAGGGAARASLLAESGARLRQGLSARARCPPLPPPPSAPHPAR